MKHQYTKVVIIYGRNYALLLPPVYLAGQREALRRRGQSHLTELQVQRMPSQAKN
jgi:hypothetical protein